MFPGKYRSDFAVQVTSQIADAQKFTINFANNNLLGSANFRPGYRTSKARVCVTVGMMTTGYDCTDILNLGLFRPIFSPTDFVQIKGRGTRRHDFRDDLLVSCPRSSFNNFSDSGLFVLSGAKDLYVPNYQTVGAIFARWLSIKMTATATFLETFFCKELLGHDTR